MSNLRLLDGTKIHKTQFNAWMKALRSREYKQAEGELENEDGFCCLGIACKVLGFRKDCYPNGRLYGVEPECQPMSPTWLERINNDFENRTGSSIVVMNDCKKMTFDEIADTLEAVYIHGVLGE